MERYIAFAGTKRYPRGGIHDFIGSYDQLTIAKKAVDKKIEGDTEGWGHVVDTWNGMEMISEEYSYEVRR